MEQLTPIIPSPLPPKKKQGWNRAKAKTRRFPILDHSRPQCLRVWQKSSGSRLILDLGVKGVQIFHLFCRLYFVQGCNLGQNKIEQQPPSPNSRMKPRKSQKAPISHHRGGGGGGYKFSIYFFQAVVVSWRRKGRIWGIGVCFKIVLLFKPHADGVFEWIGLPNCLTFPKEKWEMPDSDGIRQNHQLKYEAPLPSPHS